MKNIIPNKVAIVIYSLAIGSFGISHLRHAHAMATMVPRFVPIGIFWIYLTGIGMILAALAFIINWKAKLAGYLLALFLLIIILIIQIPGMHNGNSLSSTMFLKDCMIMAGAILIANQSA
ncbi:MAG TPA: hypothetical protein VNE41_07880 [Chitinophagaceae bacterium]|nr:hypothetical protein [Chitinophagaceae bacterium]